MGERLSCLAGNLEPHRVAETRCKGNAGKALGLSPSDGAVDSSAQAASASLGQGRQSRRCAGMPLELNRRMRRYLGKQSTGDCALRAHLYYQHFQSVIPRGARSAHPGDLVTVVWRMGEVPRTSRGMTVNFRTTQVIPHALPQNRHPDASQDPVSQARFRKAWQQLASQTGSRPAPG